MSKSTSKPLSLEENAKTKEEIMESTKKTQNTSRKEGMKVKSSNGGAGPKSTQPKSNMANKKRALTTTRESLPRNAKLQRRQPVTQTSDDHDGIASLKHDLIGISTIVSNITDMMLEDRKTTRDINDKMLEDRKTARESIIHLTSIMKDVASDVRDLRGKQHFSNNISALNKSTSVLSGDSLASVEASTPERAITPEEASAQRTPSQGHSPKWTNIVTCTCGRNMHIKHSELPQLNHKDNTSPPKKRANCIPGVVVSEDVEDLSMTHDTNNVDCTEDHTSNGKGANVDSDDGHTGSATDNKAADKDN